MQLKIKHLKEKFITIFTTNNLNALFLVDGFVVLQVSALNAGVPFLFSGTFFLSAVDQLGQDGRSSDDLGRDRVLPKVGESRGEASV